MMTHANQECSLKNCFLKLVCNLDSDALQMCSPLQQRALLLLLPSVLRNPSLSLPLVVRRPRHHTSIDKVVSWVQHNLRVEQYFQTAQHISHWFHNYLSEELFHISHYFAGSGCETAFLRSLQCFSQRLFVTFLGGKFLLRFIFGTLQLSNISSDSLPCKV